jgi:S-adenosylhomocysteine hydrolase
MHSVNILDKAINKIAYKHYHKQREKRKRAAMFKAKDVKRIIVKVDGKVVYDSNANGPMPEALVASLGAYSYHVETLLQKRKKQQKRSAIRSLEYDIEPHITAIVPTGHPVALRTLV